jgi:drug/metabolite transporter (DMT)-like permease
MESKTHRPAWKTLSAFAIIYFVWGSTFFAIRVGVHEMAPLVFAALRFLTAGILLYGWTVLRRESPPTLKQWYSILLIAFLIFVVDYGLLFWAEQRVPSGVAAVVLATIPLFIAVLEIVFLRTQKLTGRLALALLIGLAGVAVLVSRSLNLGGPPIDRIGALALIIAALSWSVASVLSRMLPLPESKIVSSGAQMLTGGMMLTLVALTLGNFRHFHLSGVSRNAWIALIYLIVAGSLIGFTAYVWLIHHESPTRVGTYAYVNPVVAVLIGSFWGGEDFGARTILGTLFVLISVLVITTTPAKKAYAPELQLE